MTETKNNRETKFSAAFINEIKEYIDQDIDLFYNTNGSTEAYKLSIKHISAAAPMNLGFVVSGHLHPYNHILLVDLDNERISEVSDNIKIKSLTNYH